MGQGIDDLGAVLSSMIKINSSTIEGQKNMTGWLVRYAHSHDLGHVRTHRIPANPPFIDKGLENITIDIGTWSTAKRRMLLYAHYDVVPPSQGQRIGRDKSNRDILYGRGSSDMLGQVLAMLLAVENISLEAHAAVRLLLPPREEEFSEGAHAARDPKNDLTDGSQVIVMPDVDVGTRVTDPPRLLLRGMGRVVFDIEAPCSPTHSALLSREQMQKELAATFGRMMNEVTTIEFPNDLVAGNLLRSGVAQCCDMRLESGEGSSQPVLARATFEAFHNHQATAAQIMGYILNKLQEALGPLRGIKCTLEDRGSMSFPAPWQTSKDDPVFVMARDVAQSVFGKPIKIDAYRGSTDMPFLRSRNIPAFGIHAPGEGLHGAHECVSLCGIERLSRFLRDYCQQFAAE